MRNALKIVTLISSLGLISLGHAGTPKITGMYSNLHMDTEVASGVELYVVHSHGAYYGTLQCAEGEPGIPETIKLSVTGASISFFVPGKSLSGCLAGAKFTGTVRESGIMGSFAGTDWPGFLKRGRGLLAMSPN